MIYGIYGHPSQNGNPKNLAVRPSMAGTLGTEIWVPLNPLVNDHHPYFSGYLGVCTMFRHTHMMVDGVDINHIITYHNKIYNHVPAGKLT
jgi:hypothetical protein